ncbi:MAG: hypothetical protein IJM21_10255 [Clostridia bacterium]|nr:hypothetical protein [Clostridia bacterium]
MACFLVPTAEALVISAVNKAQSVKEKKQEPAKAEKIPFSRKLKWLTNLLWGGSFLLAFEHVWHGEVVPFFPFLTAASNPEDAAEMLHEMATAGVGMAVAVTVVWLLMLAGAAIIEKRAAKAEVKEEA